MPERLPLKVLLTGTAGRVGQVLLEPFQARYAEVRALDRRPTPGAPSPLVMGLGDEDALRAAFAGLDVVVHLAATPSAGAAFAADLVPNNVVGTYNVLQAAADAGVRRVVFASSCQASVKDPSGRVVTPGEPARPFSPYGATKVLGEVLGRWFHDHRALEFVAIRIGSFLPRGHERLAPGWPQREHWLGHFDAVDLFSRAVERPGLGYAVVYGNSIPERRVFDPGPARELLGYEARETLE
ncbi:MAG: NAD(P)-dependent oxidoreductase [Planctomycetota bacterium]|nr:NAD(P)-dependent oxidoreductase [Planctomycetota bacterium]